MSPSYGHSYLTSYGWTGTGTGLRNGAIAKPIAIPQKKNLSGLGNDRDEAFPFWDHLFSAASKAITIKVSSDDGSEDADETEDVSPSDPSAAPLRRTTTGILSNRRPISSTPASTSGCTTPSLADASDAGAAGRLSLVATAKREAAKRGLYARFFRGPVLGPGDDPHEVTGAPELASASPEPSSSSTPVPEHNGCRKGITEETKKNKKRKTGKRTGKEEDRRERKRLKRERRTAEKAEKASAKGKVGKEDRADRKAHQDVEVWSEENAGKKARKKAQRSIAGSTKDDLQQLEGTPGRLDDRPQDPGSHRPANTADASDTIRQTKKKRKRKGTPC